MARRDRTTVQDEDDSLILPEDPSLLTTEIEFHASDRYHAVTHIKEALSDLPAETRDRIVAALEVMSDHRGHVHVLIPAPVKPAEDAPDDPALPKDGAFAIKLYHFVKV